MANDCRHVWRHCDSFFQAGQLIIPEIVCINCGAMLRKPGDMRPAMVGVVPYMMESIVSKYASGVVSQGWNAKVWHTDTEEELTIGLTYKRPQDTEDSELTSTLTLERNGIMVRFVALTNGLDGSRADPVFSNWIEREEVNSIIEALEETVKIENMPG